MTTTILHLGANQRSALQVYVFDPAVTEAAEAFGEPPFPGSLVGDALHVTDLDAAGFQVQDAANSAGDDQDRVFHDALGALAGRLWKLHEASRAAR